MDSRSLPVLALAAAQADQESSRELLVESLEIPEETAQEFVMERLGGEVDREQLMFMVELADKYCIIGQAPSEEDLFLN